jgi:hypothetical protein
MEMVLFINGNASILPCSMEMVLLINGNASIAPLSCASIALNARK